MCKLKVCDYISKKHAYMLLITLLIYDFWFYEVKIPCSMYGLCNLALCPKIEGIDDTLNDTWGHAIE